MFQNSNKENVSPEHITALTSLYKSESSGGKKEIVEALINRIDKKREYRDVAYLIIFFFFEVGCIEQALQATLNRLKGDKANAFGDVIRIIDILLAFRYEEFEEKDLDAIEKFVYSTKEHPFKIKERINAIKVRKMLIKDT